MIRSELTELWSEWLELRRGADRGAWSPIGHFADAVASRYMRSGNLLNWITLGNTTAAILLIYFWADYVLKLDRVTHAISWLERPAGLATYDDNDGDQWSVYHHDIAHIEESVAEAIHDMQVLRELALYFVFSLIFYLFKTWKVRRSSMPWLGLSTHHFVAWKVDGEGLPPPSPPAVRASLR
jgi:hypothetical protein